MMQTAAALLLLTVTLQLAGRSDAVVAIEKPTSNPASSSITENSGVGTIVTISDTGGTANRIVTTAGGAKTWTLTATTPPPECSSYFQLQVDFSTDYAYLVVASPPDFEAAKSCTATVTITDGTPATQELIISIQNTFDVPPNFIPTSYSCNFDEEQAADTLLPAGCQATYEDSEADLTAPHTPDTVVCALSGTHAAYFSVQQTVSTKLCAPKVNSKFDRDHIPTSLPAGALTFNVEAIDAAGNKASRPVTVTVVDINDNTPVCSISPISVTVAETFTGDIVGSMSCTDIDSGVNAQIVYSLMDAASSRYFSVEGTSGRVSTIVPLDYDVASTSNYTTVTIKVADSGTPTPRSTSVTVSIAITPVNDNTPVWGAFTPTDPASATAPIGSVSENADAGVVVFTAVATDADKGSDGTITYSIQSAKGSDLSNLMTAFKINSATGVVSINTKGILDRETIDYADITVLAHDNPSSSTPLTITRAIRVTIDDYNEIPPAFVPASGVYPTVTVAEGLAANSPVVTLSVTDPDKSATAIDCSIVGGNTGSVFKINAKQIDVNIQIEPDKPTSQAATYVLAVACADAGSPSALTSTATVSVSVSLTNDNPPTATFPSGTTITIPENQAVGDITTIIPNDNDTGADGTFTCSLSPAGSPFSVAAACDKLVMTSLVDRETTASYPMILTIKDGGSPSSSSTVPFTVSLTDINDNFPVCMPGSYSATFAETSPAISPLVTVTCSDADTFGISYYANTTSFTVDPNTGVVSYTGGADYDSGVSSYKVVVYAVDKNDANQYTTANVYVTVTNVNEFTPAFTDKTVNVPEPVYGGQLVTSFVASDADASPDNIKSYRITSGDPSGYFSINNAGDIFVTPGRTLDYEALSAAGTLNFALNVEAVDGATTPKTGAGTVTIQVTDINDNPPIFTQSTYTGSVTEGTGTVTGVTAVTANDADITAAFNTVQYSFSPANTYFTVDPTSGVVSKTAADLKYDSFQTVSIRVLAVDNSGAGPHTATATVVITVNSVNVAPTCTVTVLTPTVQEDMALGTQLLSMTSPTAHCSDSNALQTLSYSLSTGSDNHFAIHPSTGAMVLSKNLDFENTGSHLLTVLVKDNGSPVMSTSIVVTVTVTDFNEYAPVCTSATSASIPEGSTTGTAVFSVTGCTDSDKTATAPPFNYAINPGVPFAVDGAGAVTLSATRDYETEPTSYLVKISVSDKAPTLGGLKTTTYTTTVTILPVNDNNPVFTSPTTLYSSVSESASTTPIGTAITLTTASGGAGSTVPIKAKDDDKGNSSHSTIIYSIEGGDTNGWFSINPNTGGISTAQLLDREKLSTLTLTVSARDAAGLTVPVNTSVIITIDDHNDNAPVFPTKHLTINVTEGNTPPNTLFDFSAPILLTDADTGANAALTLEIQSGVLAAPNNRFAISGKLLQTSKTFSLASDPAQFILEVIAKDNGVLPQLTGTATVTVNIVEANLVTPTFAVGSYTINVPESTAVGASLYNASANDADHGLSGSVSYGLSSVSPVTSYFAVDNKTGNVFLQNAIDYDTAASKVFEAYIVAYDKGSPPKSNTFTLTVSITDVNDNDPQFSPTNSFSKSIAENVGSGFIVTNVVTTDPDTGLGGNVTCSIASQSTPAIFTIGTYSCVMTTTANPDRETLAVHTVMVKLTDLGTPTRTNQALFTITLTDLNDNAPTFSFAEIVSSVAENSLLNTPVTTVYATDADTGTNAAVTYSLISNDGAGDHGNFSISPTGAITVAQTLDREQKSTYSLRVLAVDGGSPPLTGTCVVNVTITDINDNTPTWVSAPYTASVSEGASLGQLVIAVSATDRDSTFGVLTYAITTGDTLGLFRIDSATGRIETAKTSGLDREAVGLWNLTLAVHDNGSPPLSATTSLTVTVTDVNEFAPAWVNSSYNFRIIENSPMGSNVGNVKATDNDAGPVNNVIYYAIDAYLQGSNYFSINPTTGDISVGVASLDRETLDTYYLRIVAWDGATPAKTATNCLTVSIFIDDANDHDPVYSKSYYNATVKENAGIGYNVFTVTGSDLDTGNNAVLIYQINTTDSAGAIANNFFSLDSSTGLLSVKSGLDRETTAFYHFPIIIYDNGTTPQRSGSASVYIIIEDVNDNAPSMSAFFNAEVPQVDDGNMKIVTITATDPDSGTGGSVSYDWSSNTPYFYIDSTTGVVTRNTLNSVENYKIYTQDVVARDSGSPQLTSAASKVRIDTFPAADYIVLIHFSMSEADYLTHLSTIKTNLAKTLVGKYPNNRVGHWKYHNHNGNIVGYFYALANTLTDNITYITVDKEFVPYADLLAFWRFDSSGTPTDILKGSDFTNTQIVKVEPYPQTASTPWYETWWGILLLVLAALAAAALLAAAIYGLVVCAKAGCGPKPTSAPASQPVKPPPPIKERQILELNQDKHPRHHPKPKGRYLIKENQGQNKGVPETSNNRTTTPKADFDKPQQQQQQDSAYDNYNGRASPVGSAGGGDATLDF